MPVEIVWSRMARNRLEEIHDFVARDKPAAAARLATRIVTVVQTLGSHPHIGRAAAEPGIRELVIGGTPYIVIYAVKKSKVVISTIWHGAQSRKTPHKGRRKLEKPE